MLERIKILIAMQLRDRHRRRKTHPLVFVLLRVLAVICITAGVWGVFFFFNNIIVHSQSVILISPFSFT